MAARACSVASPYLCVTVASHLTPNRRQTSLMMFSIGWFLPDAGLMTT
jgi:hypothetical protein